MEAYPLISVICPVYNHLNFIKMALDSILNQNYPSMEIIIGDDCSTDGTIEILRGYEQKYPQIIKVLYSDVNLGITDNCNRLLFESKGEYVAFFAGDDYWASEKLFKQIKYFKENPESVLCFTKTAVFKDTLNNILFYEPKMPFNEIKSLDVFAAAYSLGMTFSSFLIRRDAIPKSGYNKLIPSVSDWFILVEIIYKREFGMIDEPLTYYRRHSNNYSRDGERIFVEHMLTLKIAEKKYPELFEVISKWKTKTLTEYVSQSEDKMKEILNSNNAFTFFKISLNYLRFIQIIKSVVKLKVFQKKL